MGSVSDVTEVHAASIFRVGEFMFQKHNDRVGRGIMVGPGGPYEPIRIVDWGTHISAHPQPARFYHEDEGSVYF
jgi:hypothetical protein